MICCFSIRILITNAAEIYKDLEGQSLALTSKLKERFVILVFGTKFE